MILAVGETVDQDFVRASGLRAKDSGTVDVDRYTLETSRNRFYAGGDVISGASNVSNAMGFGKKAARIMDERLMGERRWEQVFPEFEYEMTVPSHPSESRRHSVAERAPEERARSFEEATVGLTVVEAMEECCRCLRCDVQDREQ